jgi:hypothetical protein
VLTTGLFYKHVMIVNYASSGINKLKASLNDDARVVIYDRHMFLVQATHHLKVKGLSPASGERDGERDHGRNVSGEGSDSRASKLVEHLPHQPKVKGLRSASVIGKGGE